MPLDREHMTVASRIMLPADALFFAVVGANWLTTSRDRLLASPGLEWADRLLPIKAWGALYILVAVVILAALTQGQRVWCRAALLFAGLITLGWAALLAVGALVSGVSPSGWAWPAYVACACWASYRSLTVRER